MGFLDGFKVFDFSEGYPYVSITKHGITFNKSVILKLSKPEYVVLYINEETKQIAIQACDKDTPKATPFYKEKKSGLISARWNGKDIMNTILEMTGWDLENYIYRIDGELLKEERAMIFDFSKPNVSAAKDVENK